MQVTEIEWSETEQQIAKSAFERAYDREVKALIAEVNEAMSNLTEVPDLWRLHDFLSIKRHALDGKYDARDSALLFVFAQLLQEGWLTIDELTGLSAEKLKKVSALTRM
jgi:beta-N-acetylglucosaminidase